MSVYRNLEDTIVALATPAGVGAIAVIRLSGKDAIQITNNCFSKNILNVPSHTIHFGTIRNKEKQIIDEVLVSVFIAPTSYTKENVVEISCHGSPYIIQQLITLFIKKGARMAEAGEFTLRAFLNGQMDLSQAEAVADLIASSSAASHELAMQQMRGGFSDEIKKLRQELIDFAALIELELDFGEEDVEFANRSDLRNLILKIQQVLKALIQSFQLGNVLKNGVNTVIAGRPNAGKSTLLNALLNEERAIVSDIAGTTRDTIEEVLNINGVNFRLIDTAGIRDAKDQIEAIGVEKTLEKINESALLVYVYSMAPDGIYPTEVVQEVQKLARTGLPVIVVGNKVDAYQKELERLVKDDGQMRETLLQQNKDLSATFPTIHISALQKENIHSLKDALYKTVIKGEVRADNTIVSNARHYDALQKAYDSLDAALNGMNNNITADFIAMDIRASLNYLAEITGDISTDDLLDSIFGRFCIGK